MSESFRGFDDVELEAGRRARSLIAEALTIAGISALVEPGTDPVSARETVVIMISNASAERLASLIDRVAT